MSRCNLVYLIIGVYSVLAQGPLVFAFGRKLSHGEMTLRVLSYNIQGTPIVGVDHDRYADIGRILKQLRDSGQGPQIVTIQEAFVSRTDELITESGYPHVQKGPGAAGLKWGSGLLILSEFPIKKSDSMIYDDCISWDCMVRKGVLYVRCDVPGLPQPLEIYDTHMNSDPDSDPSVTPEQTERVRLSQVHDLNRFIWETKISQAPAVFPADFNFHPGGLDYLFFVSGTKMRNAVEFCAKHDDKCSGDSGADEDWRTSYDHQFYFSGMSPEVRVEPIQFERNFKEKVNGRYLSDHYGLEIHYRLVF